MKLPEPYLYYADGVTYTPQAVTELFADDSGLLKLYTEAQVKELLEQAGSLLIAHMHGADQMRRRYAPVLQRAKTALENCRGDDPGWGTARQLAIAEIEKVLK